MSSTQVEPVEVRRRYDRIVELAFISPAEVDAVQAALTRALQYKPPANTPSQVEFMARIVDVVRLQMSIVAFNAAKYRPFATRFRDALNMRNSLARFITSDQCRLVDIAAFTGLDAAMKRAAPDLHEIEADNLENREKLAQLVMQRSVLDVQIRSLQYNELIYTKF